MTIISACGQNSQKEVIEEKIPDIAGFERTEFVPDTTKVASGEVFSSLFARLGVSGANTQGLIQECGTAFNPSKVVLGARVIAYRDSLDAVEPSYIIYENSRIDRTVFRVKDSLRVWNFSLPVEIQDKTADVTIETSLWVDMVNAGVSPMLIAELADIYAWTVNFFGLQKGDRFRVIYTQKVCEGEVVGIEKVSFAIYDSGSVHYPAIRFDQRDGGGKYWNEKGESMRKAFLKAPLRYNRISSRFSYHRRHPVTGKVRPHTGVDYAAPKGTPVHTIGDGTVTVCGWDPKGGGKHIRIRHANGYETAYLHLSGYAKGIRAGAKVTQGQIIGYVGSTGRSTGPHLDFRVWKDRKPLDPLKMISPPSKPLNKENLDSLGRLYEKYLCELNGGE